MQARGTNLNCTVLRRTSPSWMYACIKKPDLSVVDASVALKGSHLLASASLDASRGSRSGRHKNLGVILAGFEPVAVDTVGSELLGHNPHRLEYLKLAIRHGGHGSMNNIEIIQA
jgi:uncharacterized protein (DUF362 family)